MERCKRMQHEGRQRQRYAVGDDGMRLHLNTSTEGYGSAD